MKSKAHIKGHPLHPLLVTFPIAFFTGTLLSDLAFIFNSKELYKEIAKYLEGAGIAFALLAAVPGIIDYFKTIPPESSAKKRATKHGLINISLVIVFSLALLFRSDPAFNFYTIVAMEGVGVIMLTISGWLGGTLVYRNQIGVDHRYADAGRWQERTIADDKNRVELTGLNELKLNQMRLFHCSGKRVVVGKSESGYVAFDDHCTHRGGSLADGVMICGTVQCPWHGSQFDVQNGSVKAGPAREKIITYRLEQEGEKYFLNLI
jgi:uncharacterized membrane protein/nitrite reductase/ring-hydroxylating ferredoxin subunit